MYRRLASLLVTVILGIVAIPGCGGGGDRPPNIVVLLVDSLRADHLGCYGYDRDTSPYLDALASRGVVFERAYAQASQTKLSVASLVTGLNPPSHHVREAALPENVGGEVVTDVLSDELETLAERLQAAGYTTAGFVTNPHLEPGQGFDQGFDHYSYTNFADLDAGGLNDQVQEWLKENDDAPWFMYVHYMDVHMPYRPPRKYRFLYGRAGARMKPLELNGPPTGRVDLQRIGRTINLYDGQINYWDEMLKELVSFLPGGGNLDNTVLLVVSDHGDEFYENGGFGHGYTVYEGVIHVPLVMAGATGQEMGLRREDPVRLIDVLPTLCNLAGQPVDESVLEGSDLFAVGRAEGIPGLEVYAEALFGERPRAVRKDDRFLIFNETGKDWEYYDLVRDPYQQIDLWTAELGGLDDLYGDLERLQAGRGLIEKPAQTELDDDTVEALKSLGY